VYHREVQQCYRGYLKEAHEEIVITLLLVNDDLLVRQGLRLWLERASDITVVGEASTGTEAITLAQVLHPDVVLMDISLSTRDGIAATAALRASVPHSALVLLSLHDDVHMQARVRVAGEVTWVGKLEGVKALLAAIREAGRQGRGFPPERNA